MQIVMKVMFLLCFNFLFVLPTVFADDCLRDPLNAND